MVDALLARGLVTDDVAWLLHRNAWRWHGALILPHGPPIAGADLPIEAGARHGASLITAIYRGGEGAQEAIDEVARHRSAGDRRRRDWLANVLACIYALSFECDRHLLRELLDRTRHSTGAEWHDLAAQLARRDREEGTEAA
jgi:hypothetical protein